MYSEVVNEHAPLKIGKKHPNHAPFKNTELRKAQNVKAMLCRRYRARPSWKAWERYRKQRNLVIKLWKRSINEYFNKNTDTSS